VLAAGAVFSVAIVAGGVGVHEMSARPQLEKTLIFVLAGQSNMSGRGEVKELPESLRNGDSRVWMYSNAGAWVPAREPVDNPKNQTDKVSEDGAGVGPGLSFGVALAQRTPGVRIGLLPCAKGGSTIDSWKPAPSRDTLFGSCAARIKEARAYGDIAGVLWYQGEVDRPDPGHWRDAFPGLVEAFRREIGPRAPFVYTRLGDLAGRYKDKQSELQAFRAMQEGISLPNAVMVDAGGLELSAGGIHLTTAGYVILGQRYAEAMAALIASGAQP
jgi:hypothetical protein